MKKVRVGIFETNSSSTHAIVVPKSVNDDNYNLYDSLDHNYGFGREESRLADSWDEKLAYVYLLLKNGKKYDLKSFKDKVMSIWKELDEQDTTPTPIDVFNYIDKERNDGNLTGNDSFLILTERWGNYVDHANNVDEEFLERIIKDYDFLKRFLFNKESYITIGGDEYRGYNIKTIGFQYDYEEDYINYGTTEEPKYKDVGSFWDKLEEYKKENDVYLKGN